MIEIIDVEDMLIWAYRAQAVDRMATGIFEALGRRGPASYGQNPLALIAGLGVRVDGGGAQGAFGHGYGAGAAAVDDDALTLHDAVLRLPGLLMQTSDEGAIVLTWKDRLAATGIREGVDGRLRRDGVDVIGEWVEPTILIITNARAAKRPDTIDDFIPDFSDRPRDSAGRWIADRDSYRQTVEDVIRMRGLYAAWRAGLARLVEDCAPLRRHRLTGPAAPEAPWQAPRTATVLQDITPKPDAPAKPKRRRRAKMAEVRHGSGAVNLLS